tara:strand:- start:50 stop:289 length:240 start_codon:yes stop_codon:yes gene_type:complete
LPTTQEVYSKGEPAFIIFCKDFHRMNKHKQISMADLSWYWKNLTREEREPYIQKSFEGKQRDEIIDYFPSTTYLNQEVV